MDKTSLDFVIEKTHELMKASTCCNELKAAAQAWLDALGTVMRQLKQYDILMYWQKILKLLII